MYTIFISKSFSDSLLSKDNMSSPVITSFIGEFFQNLNIDYVVCDYDIANSNDQFHEFVFKHLYNYEQARTIKLKKSIEYYLTEGIKELEMMSSNSEFGSYLFDRSLFFVKLQSEFSTSFPHIENLNLINSLNLAATYNNFCINGLLNNSISQEEFLKNEISLLYSKLSIFQYTIFIVYKIPILNKYLLK